MEDNENVVSATETAQSEVHEENNESSKKQEKMYSRAEVNKMINAEKMKLREDLLKEAESKRTEAEKLAKMDAEQKLNYELEQKTKENEILTNKVNSLTLKAEATSYANEKGLPLGYIEDFDFGKETAESVKERIDKLTTLRTRDMESYLNDRLKQSSPKAVPDKKETDPYIEGYKNYKKHK